MKPPHDPILYFAGIGPGDPELMTLKTVRLIKTCDVLFIPTRNKGSRKSSALDTISQLIDLKDKKKVFLHFPMVKGADNMRAHLVPAARELIHHLNPGQVGVFITMGCSTIYSTAGNIFEMLLDTNIQIRFLPGISSVNAVAAAMNKPLVYTEEKLAVLPATYANEQIEACIEKFDTIVLMKVHSSLKMIIEIIKYKKLENSSYLVEKASTGEEKVILVSAFDPEYKPHYMTTVVIKKYGAKNA